jgi:hypothetical protein
VIEPDSTHYGRTGDEWGLLVAAGREFLVDQARLGRMTTYTELETVLRQRTTSRTFDFDLDSERAAMGELLGAATELERPNSGHMISAIVIYLNENDAGSGFYKLAGLNGDLPKGSNEDQRLGFWTNEVKAIHDHYR